MTEDKIEPLCQRLYNAIDADKPEEAAALGLELLAGFLVDVSRIAWNLQRLVEVYEGRHD